MADLAHRYKHSYLIIDTWIRIFFRVLFIFFNLRLSNCEPKLHNSVECGNTAWNKMALFFIRNSLQLIENLIFSESFIDLVFKDFLFLVIF